MDDGYTKENLKEALRLIRREHQLTSLLSFGKYFIVSENQITPLQAARQYSIPLSTIRSRMRRNAMKIREDGISQGRTDRVCSNGGERWVSAKRYRSFYRVRNIRERGKRILKTISSAQSAQLGNDYLFSYV